MRMRGFERSDNENGNIGVDRHLKQEGHDQNAEDMTEDNHHQQSGHVRHPQIKELEQDCNFNCSTALDELDLSLSNHRGDVDGNATNNVDVNSMSSDYQWFLDYGYKEMDNSMSHNLLVRSRQPPSIFAVLQSSNRSMTTRDLTYEDIARNIDANLAEIDMEDFRSEDINSILALPAMYCGDFRSENNGERVASLSGSIVAKVDAFVVDPSASTSTASTSDPSTSHHSNTSAASGDSTDMSVCKSELLFSPVKENGLPNLPAFSVDSLDCDSYNEQELMLTCQANMNNYTIAFEGSYMKYSDDSDYHEADGVGSNTTDSNGGGGGSDSWSCGQFKLRSSDSVDGSLVQSDCGYTTWSKLKRCNDANVDEQTFLQDDSVGVGGPSTMQGSTNGTTSTACKSQSLPNLFRKSGSCSMKISQLNVSIDSDEQCVPVYDVQQSSQLGLFDVGATQSRISDCSSQQSVSLMRLFIQQKASNSSGTPSVVHSLSSGTLQQMEQFDQKTPSEAMSSLDERLQNFLASKLNGSQESDHFESEKIGCLSGTPSNSTQHSLQYTKSADATMNALKRRMKSTTAGCKLYGGEALHEDGLLIAITPPLASPIEEEDEEERSQWSNYIDKNEANATSVSITDEDIEQSIECGHEKSQKPFFQPNSSRPNPSSLVKTRPSNKVVGNSIQADAGCSSSSSGYISVRSSMERRQSANKLVGKCSGTQIPVPVRDEAIQTSFRASIKGLEKLLSDSAKVSFADGVVQANGGGCGNIRPIYICHPKKALPDLGFLRNPPEKLVDTSKLFQSDMRIGDSLLECYTKGTTIRSPANAFDISHIQDLDSLNVLLPNEFREKLAKLKTPTTIEPEVPPVERRRPPPPLPKRSVSLPQGDDDPSYVASKPPLPKSILRRPTAVADGRKLNGRKRYSMPEFLATMQPDVTHSSSCHSDSTFKVESAPVIPMNVKDFSESACSKILFHDDSKEDGHHCCGCQLVQFELKAKKMVSFSSNIHVKRTQEAESLHQCGHNQNILSGDTEKKDFEKEWPSVTLNVSDGEVAPQLFCVSPNQETTDSNMKLSLNFQRNKALVLAVNGAIGVIGAHFNQARDHHEKFMLGNSIQTPSVVRKLVDHLCPSLYCLLNDGLQPEVYNMFGHMDNSVWLVVEAFAQSGNCNKQISDLVIHVNNDQSLWEKKMKFNAFVFGLLNIRSLDTWFAALGASNKVLQKHYLQEAFLKSTPMTSSKSLFDELLMSLQRLSMLPFELDLSLENHLNQKNLQFHSSHPSPIGRCFSCINNSSTTMSTHLSKSIPEMFGIPNSSGKYLVQHTPCGYFGHNHNSELCCWQNHQRESDVTMSQENIINHRGQDLLTKRDNTRSLRRGYSQDSAIATASSGYSNDTVSSCGDVELGTTLSTRQILCHRCSIGGWMTTDFSSRSIDQNRKRVDPIIYTNIVGLNSTIDDHLEIPAEKVIIHKAEVTQENETQKSSTSSESLNTILDVGEMQKDSQNNNNGNCAEMDIEDGAKFKKLRLKWENMTSTPSTPEPKRIASVTPFNVKSRIPRLVTKRI